LFKHHLVEQLLGEYFLFLSWKCKNFWQAFDNHAGILTNLPRLFN